MSLAKDVRLTIKEEGAVTRGKVVIDNLTTKVKSHASVLEIHHFLKDVDRADKSVRDQLLRCKKLLADEEKMLIELHELYNNTMAQVLLFIKRDLDKGTYDLLLDGIRESVDSKVVDERFWETRERTLRRLLKYRQLDDKSAKVAADLLCKQLRTLYSLIRRYDKWIKSDHSKANSINKDISSIKETVKALDIPGHHNRVIRHRDEVVQRLDSYLKQFHILERKMTQEEHEAHLRGIVTLYNKVAAKRKRTA